MVLALLSSPSSVWAAPSIVEDETAVVFNSETEGAGVSVWLVLMREHESHMTVESSDVRVVLDEERHGVFRYELEEPLPPQSVVVAIELAEGVAAVLENLPPPPPIEGEEMLVNRRPADVLLAPGRMDALVAASEVGLQTLLVRPGLGAWTSSVADGAHGDADPEADGIVLIGLDRLLLEERHRVGVGTTLPESLEAGDVVVLIDPDALTASVTRLEPEDFATQR